MPNATDFEQNYKWEIHFAFCQLQHLAKQIKKGSFWSLSRLPFDQFVTVEASAPSTGGDGSESWPGEGGWTELLDYTSMLEYTQHLTWHNKHNRSIKIFIKAQRTLQCKKTLTPRHHHNTAITQIVNDIFLYLHFAIIPRDYKVNMVNKLFVGHSIRYLVQISQYCVCYRRLVLMTIASLRIWSTNAHKNSQEQWLVMLPIFMINTWWSVRRGDIFGRWFWFEPSPVFRNDWEARAVENRENWNVCRMHCSEMWTVQDTLEYIACRPIST